MPEFIYKARSLSGKDVSGTIVAASKRETLAALGDQSLFPLSVSSNEAGQKWELKLFRRKVSAAVIASTLTQLADLLENGVPLLGSLDVMAEQAAHPTMADVLTDIRDQVSEGASLDAAFASHPEVFSDLTIGVVRAGSEGAFLEDSLKRTAAFLELQQELKAKLVGAMIYPAILGVVGFIITMVLIIFFVPQFSELFERLEREGTGLPLVTVVLLNVSDFLRAYGWYTLGGTVVLIAWFKRWAKTPQGRLVVDRGKLKIPVAGKIFLGSAVSRFCRILGTLLRNGVPLLRALEISSESAGNKILAQAIREAGENISAGDTLARPLAECGIIPKPVMAMISVAEESNNLDNVLINVADGIDRKTERQLDIFVRLIEPILLLVMGTVVMFVMVGLLLPVFDMTSAM
jgi:type II secretory pathway component PulF